MGAPTAAPLGPQYVTLSVVLSLLAAAAFLQLSSAGPHAALFDNADLLLLAHAL